MLRREELVNESHQLLEDARMVLASKGTVSEDILVIGGGSPNIFANSDWLSKLHRKLDKTIDSLSKNPQFCCQQHMKKLKLHRLAIKRLSMKLQVNAPAFA